MPADLQNSPGIPGWFIALFVIFAIIGVGTGIWRWSVLRSGGLNPFVAKEQLEARLAQSQLITPPVGEPPAGQKAVEQRLADIDDPRDRGVITEEEHVQARLKIVSGG